MVEPKGKSLIKIEHPYLYFYLKQYETKYPDNVVKKNLWLHVADNNYGACLYPSKKELQLIANELNRILAEMPDDVGVEVEED